MEATTKTHNNADRNKNDVRIEAPLAHYITQCGQLMVKINLLKQAKVQNNHKRIDLNNRAYYCYKSHVKLKDRNKNNQF